MRKGEIWWADLPGGRGSEPAKKRPVLVIQGDAFNRSNIATVVCAIITSNTRLASSPANILLETGVSKLPKRSVINFSQIVTVDKSYFGEFVSMLPKSVITEIDTSIKQFFEVI